MKEPIILRRKWNDAGEGQHPQDWSGEMTKTARLLLFTAKGVLVVVLLSIATSAGFAREKYETIQAQAFGTGTQMGQNIGITVTIYEFSPPEARQSLVE